MCPDFGRDLPVENSEEGKQKTEESDRRNERQPEPNVETNMESEENNPSFSTDEDTISKAMIMIDEMREMLDNYDRKLDETMKVMVKREETFKTSIVIEEENELESTQDGLQYQLLPLQSSSGYTSIQSSLQLNSQNATEVVEISSDEEGGENETNKIKRLKPWPKKADPEESVLSF